MNKENKYVCYKILFLRSSGTAATEGQVVAVDDIHIKGDEFWDYSQQIDLEAFSTKDFFTTMSKQSSEVTSALARQKDQVGNMFCSRLLGL